MGDSIDKQLDASDSTIRGQVLRLDRWLIPQQNAEIPRFTRGNQVDALIDGETAFQAMHDAFSATRGEGNYIYITGWQFRNIHLLGRTRGAASQVVNVLRTAASPPRSVDVRLLLFSLNNVTAPNVPNSTRFRDDKVRSRWGSHHQKTAVVRTNQELISFVGGIDITFNRWDTKRHNFRDPDAHYSNGGATPWHDVHARVRGPAAADIETNFRQRWNDRNRLPGMRPTPPVPTHPAPAPLPRGSHVVQTLRTFPHHATALYGAWHYDFAPTGEFGLRLAYLNAIGNAREYIYIEDQYMVGDDISIAIEAAMRRSPELKVILVTAPEPDGAFQFVTDAFDFHQNAFLARLRAVDPARVAIYHIENAGTPRTGVYVHSKVCIIDDIWAIVGSCNTNRRSLTHDSEISIVVLDETVENGRRKFARDLRIALWSEHLGLTPSELPLIDNAVTGASEWASRAGRLPAHAVVHTRPSGSNSGQWNTRIDPDGSRP